MLTMRPELRAPRGVLLRKNAELHPSGQEMTFPRPGGLYCFACSIMVIEKYHFHLGLHKVFVMFAAMFFVRPGRCADWFHAILAEQSPALCIDRHLRLAGA
jgi:hypothetical protein